MHCLTTTALTDVQGFITHKLILELYENHISAQSANDFIQTFYSLGK